MNEEELKEYFQNCVYPKGSFEEQFALFKEIWPISLVDSVPAHIYILFTEAFSCYILQLHLACRAMVATALEAALREKLDPEDKKYSERATLGQLIDQMKDSFSSDADRNEELIEKAQRINKHQKELLHLKYDQLGSGKKVVSYLSRLTTVGAETPLPGKPIKLVIQRRERLEKEPVSKTDKLIAASQARQELLQILGDTAEIINSIFTSSR